MLNLNDNITELFDTIMISELIKSKHQAEKDIRAKEQYVDASLNTNKDTK